MGFIVFLKAGEERLPAAGSPLGQEDCAPMGRKGSGAFTDKPLWGLKVLKFDSGFAAEGCGGRLTFIEGALL